MFDDSYVKLGGMFTKQVAGKAAGFFNAANVYQNIGKGKYVAVLKSGSWRVVCCDIRKLSVVSVYSSVSRRICISLAA